MIAGDGECVAFVLLVDDDPAALRLLTRVLERAGHRVVTAADGAAGVAAYHANRPDWVITDLVMPGMDGIGLIAEIRLTDPNARIVAATGQLSEVAIDAAIRAGATATLRKPLEMPQVATLLEELGQISAVRGDTEPTK